MCCGSTSTSRAQRQEQQRLTAMSAPREGLAEHWFVLRPNATKTAYRKTRAEAASDLVELKGRGTILSAMIAA